tara:strand:+ start:759 stop:1751 length:993 start_codon:yes stop_codon:yes gene_type:complete
MDLNGNTVVGMEETRIGIRNGVVRSMTTAAESMKTNLIKSSLLEQKSYLQFEYPNEIDPTAPPRILRLPFFEDPEIRESKTARYASYKPTSRASELFAYLGSDARGFNLIFNLTLPHLAAMLNTDRGRLSPKTMGTKEAKESFFAGSQGRAYDAIGPKSSDYTKKYSPTPFVGQTEGLPLQELGYPLTPEGYDAWWHDSKVDGGDTIKDLLVYWIDIIRSSVYNNVQNPVFGPPIVKLTHGILYRNIPCIVTNYSIAFDPNTGYDKDTMIPRVIKIDMELKEIRAGDFGQFNASKVNSIEGENLAGWEAVLTSNDNQIGGTLDVLPILNS